MTALGGFQYFWITKMESTANFVPYSTSSAMLSGAVQWSRRSIFSDYFTVVWDGAPFGLLNSTMLVPCFTTEVCAHVIWLRMLLSQGYERKFPGYFSHQILSLQNFKVDTARFWAAVYSNYFKLSSYFSFISLMIPWTFFRGKFEVEPRFCMEGCFMGTIREFSSHTQSGLTDVGAKSSIWIYPRCCGFLPHIPHQFCAPANGPW